MTQFDRWNIDTAPQQMRADARLERLRSDAAARQLVKEAHRDDDPPSPGWRQRLRQRLRRR